MSDDKSKTGRPDRDRLAGGEAYEVDYAARVLQGEFPGKTRAQIEQAIRVCAAETRFHNNRELVMNCARAKLKSG